MLNDTQCRNAKPRDRAYKMADSHGLFLYVSPTGFRSWRWKYRIDVGGKTKEKQMVLGAYPAVSIREARALRDDARDVLASGRDPALKRVQEKAQAAVDRAVTFETVARQWLEQQRPRWREKTYKTAKAALENDAFPILGESPIRDVTAPMVLAALRTVEARKAFDQAHRLRQRIDAIFAMAIGSGIAETNPAAMVGKALQPIPSGSYRALRTIGEARSLLIETEIGPFNAITKLASRFLAVTAARSEAVRFAEWSELERLADPAAAQWRIPGAHMKGQREQRADPNFEFIVPLPQGAVDVIEAVRAINGNAPLVFGSVRDPRRPMSDGTISKMYREQGYGKRHVPHGWRSTFSTIMNEWADEHGRPGDRAIIDLMLAHKPQGVEAIYNRAAYMTRRRELATIWADMLLDGLPPASSLLELGHQA